MILHGKRIIIVGVGPGLGQTLAHRCAAQGADVLLVARSRERIAALAAELTAAGHRAVAAPVDLAEPDAGSRIAAAVEHDLGGVDGIVFNAFARPPLGPLTERTAQDWSAATATNLAGPLGVIAALRAAFGQRGRSSVVLVSSISARDPYPGSGIYAATKAALHSVARSLAVELGPEGVNVNTLVPGYIEGPSLDPFFVAEADRLGSSAAVERARAEGAAALGRFATPTEVADVAVFLLSDLASGVTGQAIDVNAGQRFSS